MNILLVEDERRTAAQIQQDLRDLGHTVTWKEDASSALAAFKGATSAFDVSIIDLGLPATSGSDEPAVEHGFALIRSIRKSGYGTYVMILTQRTDKETFDHGRNAEVDAFLIKPLSSDQLKVHLWTAERFFHQEESFQASLFRDIVGQSKCMLELHTEIQRAAKLNSPVLILGESGSGKELIAKAIHVASTRAEGPFIAANCARLPKELAESELFGHEEGAFTGAVETRIGAFELAKGGTLFLDEVGDMPIEVQPKLFRVLDQWEFTRVGGKKVIKVDDVRVVAATNKDVSNPELFRNELYQRLGMYELKVPSLNERLDDIPLLVKRLLEQIADAEKLIPKPVTQPAITKLKAHKWTGNVRELKGVLLRALVRSATPEIREDDISFNRGLAGSQSAVDAWGVTVAEAAALLPCELNELKLAFERKFMIAALQKAGGKATRICDDELLSLLKQNKLQAARELSIARDGDFGASALLGLPGKTFDDRAKRDHGIFSADKETWRT